MFQDCLAYACCCLSLTVCVVRHNLLFAQSHCHESTALRWSVMRYSLYVALDAEARYVVLPILHLNMT
jgi:hypothetical protein